MLDGVSQNAIIDVAAVPCMVNFKHALIVLHEQE
jgi:hypothetical protein